MTLPCLVALAWGGSIAWAQAPATAPSETEPRSAAGEGGCEDDGEGGEGGEGQDTTSDLCQEPETFTDFEPGQGFLVVRTPYGDMTVGGYALIRWIDQLDDDDTYRDHLGRERPLDLRNDIQWHRMMVHFKGFLFVPRFKYQLTVWSVLSTQQTALVGSLRYEFHRAFTLYGGVGGLPGTRTLLGSHPYWLAADRVLADEYFRPGFTSGVWATGEPIPRFWYMAMVGNNLSQLGITARQLTKDLAYSTSLWVLPTTGEFGPKGAFGDFEDHRELATRIGVAGTYSRENRYADVTAPDSANTQTKLSDGVDLFDRGALAREVTVLEADWLLGSADAGMKYRGFFLQGSYFYRLLQDFDADGPLAVDDVRDHGFYVQASMMVVPKLVEPYAATSYIFGDFDRRPWEVLGGLNVYPAKRRGWRLNGQLIRVEDSPADSVFGYYVGGQDGWTVSLATDINL